MERKQEKAAIRKLSILLFIIVLLIIQKYSRLPKFHFKPEVDTTQLLPNGMRLQVPSANSVSTNILWDPFEKRQSITMRKTVFLVPAIAKR